MRHLFMLGFLLLAFKVHAQTEVKAEHSGLKIFALQTQIKAGEALDVAMDFTLEPEWHIYWRNPGDSGAAPKVSLQGAVLQDWQWPAPERLSIPPLTNYGYGSRVVFPARLLPEATATEISFDFEWLVCKIECVPVFAKLKLPVKFGDTRIERSPEDPERVLYEEFLARVPKTTGAPKVQVSHLSDRAVSFRLSGQDLKMTEELWVFPREPGIFKTAAPTVTRVDRDFEISVPLDANRDPTVQNVNLTLVLKGSLGQKAFDVPVSLQEAAPGLGRVLLFAFLGGLILNLMPCVFPVLALKVFGILREPNRIAVRRSGWLYTAGVLFSFLVLGAALMGLRTGGEALGWGFQLQSPTFVLAMLVLFFLMALNFAGLFEIGMGVMNTAGRLSNKSSLSGAFGTGVLAVFVASPCTAPFMGSALGATLLMPVTSALLVFGLLGLGLAFPILLFGEIPALARRLPKPGAWMETFKQFMAFPMLATAAWLLWVLQFQTGPNFMLQTLIALILLSLALWILPKSKTWVGRSFAIVIFLGALIWVAIDVQRTKAVASTTAATDVWQKFTKEKVAAAKGKNPVFVDFTASWCITCQVNKLNVLNTKSTQALFREKAVLLLKADWTDRDPLITEALRDFRRNSVPLYVYYSTDGDVKVLPEILTATMITELFKMRRTQ